MNNHILYRFYALSALLCLGLWTCSDEGQSSGTDLRRQTLESLANGVILPLYRDVESKAQELNTAAAALCAAPNDSGLEAARQAWWDARTPWKQAEVLAFGPYAEEPVRLGPKIDFWPARETSILGVLEGDSALTPDAIANVGAASRGFPAIEYLLYQDDALTLFQSDARRCLYLTALTGDLATNTIKLRNAWDPDGDDYLSELVNAGEGSQAFETLAQAVGEVANRMAFVCENIRSDKLNTPLGMKADGTPQPETVESRFSDRSVQDIIDNLRGIEALFTGTYNGVDGDGWSDYMKRRGRDIDASFQAALTDAKQALEAIPGPLKTAIVTHPEAVEAALQPLRELQRIIQTDMIGALGVSVSFNDNDGD